MTPLETRIKEFADRLWPERTLAQRVSKLGEEIGEFIEALCADDEKELHREAGDVGILLADILGMCGVSFAGTVPCSFTPLSPGQAVESIGFHYGRMGRAVFIKNERRIIESAGRIAAAVEKAIRTDLQTVMERKFELVRMKHDGVFFDPA